jgi:hypothetical protein
MGDGQRGIAPEFAIAPGMPHLVVPSWAEVWRSFEVAVLPQLSLTLTNAVIVTASLDGRYTGDLSVARPRETAHRRKARLAPRCGAAGVRADGS